MVSLGQTASWMVGAIAALLLVAAPARGQQLIWESLEPGRVEPLQLDTSLSMGVVQAAQEDAAPASDESPWKPELYIAFWVPVKVDGTVTIGVTTSVDLNLSEILTALQGVVEGGISFSNETWSLHFSGLWFKLGADSSTQLPLFGERDTSLTLKLGEMDLAVGRRLATWSMGEGGTTTCSVDVLAGLRYWTINIEIDEDGPLGPPVSLDQADDWVDFIIGGGLRLKVSDRLDAFFRGDVGGFGIGTSSDFTWSFTFLAKFKLTNNIDFVAGYRYVDIEWSQTQSGVPIAYDLVLHGPIVGVGIRF